ncbi:MAG: DNA-binding protein WhiA [Christensenellaceae bacterium]|jgi:DNA-binding protein WhiA|nr:DNA-binding protein WhiA [Christensenellaceae bacterium]
MRIQKGKDNKLGGLKELSKTDNIIVRIINNDANRKTNCDTANLTKLVRTSKKQTELFENIRTDNLSPKLKMTIKIRLENPDASYNELSQMLGITKSGLVHRLYKILQTSNKE